MAECVRSAAARALHAVRSGRSLPDALPPLEAGFDERDRGLLRELVYGSTRWSFRLDHYLDTLLQKPVTPELRALLAAGIYQLGWTRIPDHAAVAATVEASARLGQARARGLVNAVLRNFIRRRAELEQAAAGDPGAYWSHPRWLIEQLQQDWPGDWQRILQANNDAPPMTLRVNARRSTRDAYLARLAQAGFDAAPTPHTETGVTLAAPAHVTALPGFAQGLVSVQDGAGQLAGVLLDAQPGMRVLDACAAPGGKACHLLERTPDLAELVALDIDETRLERVAENLERLGLAATLRAGDAARTADWWDGQPFDRILLDAPCSATGVIRRHPDIRLLRQEADIATLAGRQRGLLDALRPLLAPGGRLLYATCSVLRAENDAVMAGRPPVALAVPWGRAVDRGRQVLPGDDAMDGFYYAWLT